MKKILYLFLAIVCVSCNQGEKQTSNETKKDVNTTSQVEVIKKELNASDIYTTSKPKVALLISYDQITFLYLKVRDFLFPKIH